ncbi:Eukaryotic phosphomannomutase [uncultured archaeon]|nr:Eukaryotic phosphomannomutase [uncultured archaeon]
MLVSDLDGTLAESKSDLTKEMSGAIAELLKFKKFAVIGGGSYAQFQKQFVAHLDCPQELLSNLYLFPTCATAFYVFEGGKWKEVYVEELSAEEKQRIVEAFHVALEKSGVEMPGSTYGEQIEDRRTQITFSALGQQAPLELKSKWDPDKAKRNLIKRYMDEIIPEFEVNIGGTNSIDVTKKGIDKAYGIRKIMSRFSYAAYELLFVGDALFVGGNDYPVTKTGVDCVKVEGPKDTMRLFSKIASASRQ